MVGLRGRGRSHIRAFHAAGPEELHLSSALPHFANIAWRTGRMPHFDGAKEVFLNDREANAMLRRDYRAPYLMPERV